MHHQYIHIEKYDQIFLSKKALVVFILTTIFDLYKIKVFDMKKIGIIIVLSFVILACNSAKKDKIIKH